LHGEVVPSYNISKSIASVQTEQSTKNVATLCKSAPVSLFFSHCNFILG